MKIYRNILLIFTLFLFSSHASARKTDSLAVINGVITADFKPGKMFGYAEPGDEVPYRGVRVVIYYGRDSLSLTTDSQGRFGARNIPVGNIRMKITAINYKTIDDNYELAPGQNAFYFKLEEANPEIKEAVVSAEVPLIKQVADTTVYNTSLINTAEGESLREALKMLPGFSFKKGKFSVNGKDISRTYVNGVLMFGNGTTTAIDALNADEVSQVRVWDELNVLDKHRGIRGGKKERVLDIKTKERFVSLSEMGGYVVGGADGTGQPRYAAGVKGDFFSETLLLNAYGGSNNLNQKSLSGSPVRSLFSSGGIGRPLSKYAENSEAGAAVSKYWGNRLFGNSLSASYRFSHDYDKSARRSCVEYFETADNPAYSRLDTLLESNVKKTHNASISGEFNNTAISSIKFSVSGNISDDSRNRTNAQSQSYPQAQNLIRDNEAFENRARDYGLSGSLSWAHNELKTLRPSYSISVGYQHDEHNSWTVDTLRTSYNRRQLQSDGNGNALNISSVLSLEYDAINEKTSSLKLLGTLQTLYNNSGRNQLSVNVLDADNPIIDLANTFRNTWNELTNSFNAGLRYTADKLELYINADISNVLSFDREAYPQAYSADRVYWTSSPSIVLRYKCYSLNAGYSSSIPSAEQSRNRITDTNPLSLVGGNPNLRKSGRVSLNNFWHFDYNDKRSYSQLYLDGGVGFNDIVTKTCYFSKDTPLDEWDGYVAKAGSILNTFENSSLPSWNVKASVENSLNVKKKLNLSLNASSALNATPQYSGNEILSFSDWVTMAEIVMNYRPNKLFNLSLSPNCQYLVSKINFGKMLSERLNLSVSAKIHAVIAKNGSGDVSYSGNFYKYLSGAGNDHFYNNLSVSFGWSFLKRTLHVSVGAYDILNSSSTYSTTVTANSFTQTWNPHYGRYFLASVSYIFRNKKK